MSAKVERIILAGFGGQGVLFLGRLLAEAALKADKNVSWVPSYGYEIHTPTANCSLIIAENQIASPMITVPDSVIAMNTPSLNKFSQKIKGGGMLMYNSSLVDRQEFRDDIRLVEIPATDMANDLGDPSLASLVMAGAYAKFSNLVTYEGVEEALRKLLEKQRIKEDEINLNIEALKQGFKYVEETRYMSGRYAHAVFRGI